MNYTIKGDLKLRNFLLFIVLFATFSLNASAKVDSRSIPELLVSGTQVKVRVKNANTVANPAKVVLFTEDGSSYNIPVSLNRKGTRLRFVVPSVISDADKVYKVTLHISGGDIDANLPRQFIRFLLGQSATYDPGHINLSLQGTGVTLPSSTPSLLESLVGPQGPQGPRGAQGFTGSPGAQGPAGANGADGNDAPVYMTLSASRDYDSSAWYNFSAAAPATGTINPPDSITVTAGNTGTGWLTLQIGSHKVCYQGTARSNNNISRVFSFEHIISSAQCATGLGSKTVVSSDANYNVPVTQGDTMGLEVNGGGVSSSIRTYTSVVIPNLHIDTSI